MGFSSEVLEAIGMSEFEEDVYVATLDNGPCSAAEVSGLVGSTTPRVRRAIERLEEKGLVNRSADAARYSAVAPSIALGVLIAQRHEQLERARLTLNEWDERYRRRATTRSPGELIEVVADAQNVGQRFVQLTRAARDEILILDKPPYSSSPQTHRSDFEEAVKRGAHQRTIYDASSLEVAGRVDEIRRSLKVGEDALVHPALPMKLAIFDREIALLPVTRDLSEGIDGALIVHRSSLLDALVALWQLLYSQATKLERAEQGLRLLDDQLSKPDEVEAKIIIMMLAGLKVEAIARQLGLAKSTVDRKVARILKDLGANNRFQAGYNLAERRHATGE